MHLECLNWPFRRWVRLVSLQMECSFMTDYPTQQMRPHRHSVACNPRRARRPRWPAHRPPIARQQAPPVSGLGLAAIATLRASPRAELWRGTSVALMRAGLVDYLLPHVPCTAAHHLGLLPKG